MGVRLRQAELREARGLPFAALLLLAACAQPTAAPGPAADAPYTREPAALAGNDTNVYSFEHDAPDGPGTVAVTARPTAGPDAVPGGTLAGPTGREKAEAAAAFYARNTLCGGADFRIAGDRPSRYQPGRNSWTVFGRCARA